MKSETKARIEISASVNTIIESLQEVFYEPSDTVTRTFYRSLANRITGESLTYKGLVIIMMDELRAALGERDLFWAAPYLVMIEDWLAVMPGHDATYSIKAYARDFYRMSLRLAKELLGSNDRHP